MTDFEPTVNSVVEPMLVHRHISGDLTSGPMLDLTGEEELPPLLPPNDPVPITPHRQPASITPIPLRRQDAMTEPEVKPDPDPVITEPIAQAYNDPMLLLQSLGAAFVIGSVTGMLLTYAFSRRVVSEE